MRSHLLLLLMLAVAATACVSVNPATGRREVILMSTEREQEIDEEVARQIEGGPGIVREPGLAAYISTLGQSLAKHSPRQDVDYHFSVVEMEEPNAFALPGGHVYVSRGLVVMANSEDEVANVLGHEIAHVAARHAAQQQTHANTLGLATLITELIGGAQESHESESVSGHYVTRYARNQEREADQIGQRIAIEAGLNPRGLADFMRTLDNLSKINEGFSVPQMYFATHPASRERMLEAGSRAQQREWQEQGAGREGDADLARSRREQFYDRIEGMAVGRPASEGVFVEERFLHADFDFSLRFPHGWTLINQASEVVGLSPRKDGIVLLQLDSEGSDPVAAAQAFAERESLGLGRGQTLKVGGLPAYRARTSIESSVGRIDSEITWIAHRGRIYRLIAGMREGNLSKYHAQFRRFSHSFRPLTPAERGEITELRLRTTRTLPGETLAQLSKRIGNEWDPIYTAVANGLQIGEPLPAGLRVKVAIRESFVVPPRLREPPSGDTVTESASGDAR